MWVGGYFIPHPCITKQRPAPPPPSPSPWADVPLCAAPVGTLWCGPRGWSNVCAPFCPPPVSSATPTVCAICVHPPCPPLACALDQAPSCPLRAACASVCPLCTVFVPPVCNVDVPTPYPLCAPCAPPPSPTLFLCLCVRAYLCCCKIPPLFHPLSPFFFHTSFCSFPPQAGAILISPHYGDPEKKEDDDVCALCCHKRTTTICGQCVEKHCVDCLDPHSECVCGCACACTCVCARARARACARACVRVMCARVCVCAGGRTILKREARMGPGPLAVA